MKGFPTNAPYALALPILLIAGVLACSPQSRYQTLNFFFDGVPEPGSTKSLEPNTATDEPTSATLAATVPVVRSVHMRIEREQCAVCHVSTGGLGAPSEVSMALCDQCHGDQRREQKWDHGPINLGQCLPCHAAGHDSGFPKLLTRPVDELCLFCHTREVVDVAHEKAVPREDATRDCVKCHDPHRMEARSGEPEPVL